MGEISSSYTPDYEAIAREVISSIGYNRPVPGFDASSCRVELDIRGSPRILPAAFCAARGAPARGSGYDVRLCLPRARRKASCRSVAPAKPPDKAARYVRVSGLVPIFCRTARLRSRWIRRRRAFAHIPPS